MDQTVENGVDRWTFDLVWVQSQHNILQFLQSLLLQQRCVVRGVSIVKIDLDGVELNDIVPLLLPGYQLPILHPYHMSHYRPLDLRFQLHHTVFSQLPRGHILGQPLLDGQVSGSLIQIDIPNSILNPPVSLIPKNFTHESKMHTNPLPIYVQPILEQLGVARCLNMAMSVQSDS